MSRAPGAVIMIDRLTNVTIAGGMVIEALQGTAQAADGKSSLRQELQALLQQPLIDAELATALKKLLSGNQLKKTAKPKSAGKKKKPSPKTSGKKVTRKTKAKR